MLSNSILKGFLAPSLLTQYETRSFFLPHWYKKANERFNLKSRQQSKKYLYNYLLRIKLNPYPNLTRPTPSVHLSKNASSSTIFLYMIYDNIMWHEMRAGVLHQYHALKKTHYFRWNIWLVEIHFITGNKSYSLWFKFFVVLNFYFFLKFWLV